MYLTLSRAFFIIFLAIFLAIGKCYSQDLSYYVIGEKELKNAEIYSILQTNDSRLYVSTNEGLYLYKHGKMNPITSQVQKGTSLFNLRENSKGQVFCYNLNGQVFIIEKNKLILYFEIPKELVSVKMSMEFDENDNLIFGSNGCFAIDGAEIKMIYKSSYGPTEISKLPDGRIFLAKKKSEPLIQIIDKDTVTINYSSDYNSQFSRPIYILGDSLIDSGILNKVRNNYSNEKSTSLTEYFQYNNKTIWRRNYTSGVETIVLENGQIEFKETYFKNIFISKIANGVNGELFFGTFGKGLIVVPNKRAIQHSFGNNINNIQSIVANNDETIFISDRINGLLSYKNNQLTKINVDIEYIPENVFSTGNINMGLSNRFPSFFYKSSYLPGALKNISVFNNTILMSTSEGIHKLGTDKILGDSLWVQNKKLNNAYTLKGIKARCLDAVFVNEKQSLYISTIESLIKINEKGEKELITINGKEIIGNDLLIYDEKLWVASQSMGLIIFRGDNEFDILNTDNGLSNNFVNKIEEKNGLIYISTKSGFQIYNAKDKIWRTIATAEGVEIGSVDDFTVTQNDIWFASNSKLLSMPLEELESQNVKLDIHIDSIKVGNKFLSKTSDNIFHFKENELSIYPDFRVISNQKEAFYQYQLMGLDNEKKRSVVTESLIHYNYLPPGNYTFLLKVKYRNKESKELVYNFTIKKPYWQTWWFYLITAVLVVLVLVFYFSFRNKKNRRLNEEKLIKQSLKMSSIESELRALRAQMNPHFIFNSLNSIQDLILKKDTHASYDYIVLFSDLVRNSLKYSNQEFIMIKEEIEFLNTYLSLEKLRFGDAFSYEILNESLGDIKLPALVIQPFVENAIVHGLFHKKGKKKLKVDFKEHPAGLQCIITDNGVGRGKAKEIQKRQGNTNDSYALEAIRQRLDILAKKHQKAIGYKVEDLTTDKIPSGTKITVILPNIAFS